MRRLDGKRALITGGTTGIGLATAMRFLSEGARVAVTGANPVTLAAAREQLGPDALVIQSDAGAMPAQKAVADQIRSAFGQLDILFLNAGVVDLRPVEQWDEAAFDRSLSINVKGPFFLIQALLPVFASPASIVLTSSINGHLGMPGTTVYGATKAALGSMARTLSGELIARGIRVNSVSPGPIDTPAYHKLGLSEAAQKALQETLVQQIPARRFGTPDEVAEAVLFFASNASPFTVGSELVIDGAMSIA